MDNDHDDSDNDQHVQDNDEDEDERIAAAVVAAEERRLQYISILQRQGTFPLRQRNKLDTMIERDLRELGDDIHDYLCDRNVAFYQGLDSSRDTKEEVETAVREFPPVLSRRKKDVRWDADEEEWVEDEDEHNDAGEYPIRKLLYMYGTGITGCTPYFNLKAIPFIALLVRLGIELNQFKEEERGGLLTTDALGLIPLRHLALSSYSSYNNEHNQLVDNTSLAELIQLRQMGVFIKEDIIDHDLVIELCCEAYFAKNRFTFLIEWDPTPLTQANTYIGSGCLLLHYAATSIEKFQFVFDYVIRYYPTKKGISLLFQKDNDNETPLQDACKELGREKVIQVIEETLCRYSDTPLNIGEALVVAATDETIHLDCIHFLLTRQPDMLVKLLSKSTDNNDSDDDHNNGDHNDDEDGDDDRNRKNTNNCGDNYVDREKDDDDGNHSKSGDGNDSIENTDVDVDSNAQINCKKRKRTRMIPNKTIIHHE